MQANTAQPRIAQIEALQILRDEAMLRIREKVESQGRLMGCVFATAVATQLALNAVGLAASAMTDLVKTAYAQAMKKLSHKEHA